MAQEKLYVLGYDVGGTKIAVCVGDSEGNILAHTRLPSGAVRDYQDALPDMVQAGRDVVAQAGLSMADIAGCGVCAPGPLDVPNGLMLKSPNMKWDRVPIRDDLARELQLPVFFENDANGGGLAEGYFGAAKGSKDLVYLTMSTGVGGGVICGGKLLQGSRGLAGELGHIVLQKDGPKCGCGMHGCFEAYCGGRTVARRFREMVEATNCQAILDLPEVKGDLDKLDFIALRAGSQAGIPEAVQMWDEVCYRLAQGIGLTMMTFNPQVVVLGTLALYSGDILMDPVNKYLPLFAWPEMLDSCRIETTKLGTKIGELAGICVALYGLGEQGRWQPPVG